jgi:hypothetical protein
MARHKQKPSNINVELAQHCIEDVGSVNSPICPIIEQRSRCEGLGLTETFFDFLVQAMMQRDEIGREEGKQKRHWHELHGQVNALIYVVAAIENPYDPDMEAVLARAEEEATERANALEEDDSPCTFCLEKDCRGGCLL